MELSQITVEENFVVEKNGKKLYTFEEGKHIKSKNFNDIFYDIVVEKDKILFFDRKSPFARVCKMSEISELKIL